MRFKLPSYFCSILLFGVIVFWCTSCDKLAGKVNEGTVEYDISYPALDPNSIVLAGMPNKAYYKFKNNNSITEMEGMMGLITITFVSDYKKKTITQKVNLVQKKYASVLDEKKIDEMNKSFTVKEMKLLSGTKEIAGKKCKKAEATLGNGEKIIVFYTNEISVKDPNWNNPYKEIDGVLMEFQIERYGIVMNLTAKTVTKEAVNDKEFLTSFDEYKKIPAEKLDNMLRELNPIR